VRTTRAALPHLVERGGGIIVTIRSVKAFPPDQVIID
jgi:short-subunit dehydrogenase